MNSSWHVAHVHVLSDTALAGLCVAGCPVVVGISPDISTSGPSPTNLGSSGGSSAFRFVPRGDPVTVSASGPVPVNLGSSGGVSAVRFDPLVGAAGNTPPALMRSSNLARFATPPSGVGLAPPGTVVPGAMGGGSTPLDEAPGGGQFISSLPWRHLWLCGISSDRALPGLVDSRFALVGLHEEPLDAHPAFEAVCRVS